MLIFLDDSGDPGFKFDKGSSRIFVIALVIFDDDLDAEETALKIKRLRQHLKKSERFEFKFSKCSKKLRKQFLERVADCKFKARVIVIQKDKMTSQKLKRSFYHYTIMLLLRRNKKFIKEARLRLDGQSEREFRREMTVYLRKNVGKKTIKNLRFRQSRNDVLMQLADMIAGSIRRSFSDKKDAGEYMQIIKEKIKDIWICPE